jgi:MoxR-like ATPase
MTTEETSGFVWDEGHSQVNQLIENIEKVMVGKREVIRLCIAALLAKGHVLLEDVPGVGKTMLVKALARSLGCRFRRIQFTPDLLPSDVVGVSVFNQKSLDFEYRPGPLMSHVVLADEINRTSPKTQAAMLEAMEEGHVTVDGHTYPLPTPFFVMATQNPMSMKGRFHCRKRSWIGFCLSLGWDILRRMKKWTCSAGRCQISPWNSWIRCGVKLILPVCNTKY